MFGKKNKKENKEKGEIKKYRIETIPDIFYGGQDPEIYHPKEAKSTLLETKRKPSKKPAKKPTSPVPRPVSTPGSKKKFLIVASSVVFVLVVAGISWYYFDQARPRIAEQPQEDVTEEVLSEEQETETPTDQEEQDIGVDVAETTTTEDGIDEVTPESDFEFPRVVLLDSNDLDSDALTDLEEELFETDSGIWDTDEDGYYDGQEVVNLYSPKGLAPSKLIDSGLVREYVNPTFSYRFYYPISWEIGVVDPSSRQVLVSAVTGDYIEIRAIQLETGETFRSWFSKNASGQRITDISDFTNRFKEEGRKRNDNLVGYFVDGSLLYVIIYHSSGMGSINYRHVMEMVLASFRPTQSTVDIPDQVILPGLPGEEPITTTTEENISTSTEDGLFLPVVQ